MDFLIAIVVIVIVLAALANIASRFTHPYRVTLLYKNSPHKMRFNTSLFTYTQNYRGEDAYSWNQLEPTVKPMKLGVDDVMAVSIKRRLPYFLIRLTRTTYLKKDKERGTKTIPN